MTQVSVIPQVLAADFVRAQRDSNGNTIGLKLPDGSPIGDSNLLWANRPPAPLNSGAIYPFSDVGDDVLWLRSNGSFYTPFNRSIVPLLNRASLNTAPYASCTLASATGEFSVGGLGVVKNLFQIKPELLYPGARIQVAVDLLHKSGATTANFNGRFGTSNTPGAAGNTDSIISITIDNVVNKRWRAKIDLRVIDNSTLLTTNWLGDSSAGTPDPFKQITTNIDINSAMYFSFDMSAATSGAVYEITNLTINYGG